MAGLRLIWMLIAILALTGSPTLAGAAGGAAQSATEQYASTGTVDGGLVAHDAALGAAGGKLGALASKVLGCATNKVVKAVAGMAADAGSAVGTQVVENVLNGDPPSYNLGAAAMSGVPGAGVVISVLQRESCFLAGTSVTLGCGDQAMIEALRVGQRVLTPSSLVAPQQGDSETVKRGDEETGGDAELVAAGVSTPKGSGGSETDVDPATWRSYTVRLRDGVTGWDVFDITLLRPQGWVEAQSRRLDGHAEVWVDFAELNAKGWAEVIEEAPCPKIAEGAGRVITATITHANDDVRTLTMSSGEVLYVTGNHRIFSATRQDWVPVKDLQLGEDLRTVKGRESAASLGYQRGRHQVYNIEVETEHCYFVGNGEVLTHNTCGPDGGSLALTHSAKKSPNPWGKNGGPEHQAAVDAAVADMQSRGLNTEKEVPVKTTGGKKDTRFIDAAGYQDGKIVEIHQAGRGLKSNPDKPVSRERDAFRDMRRVPELNGAKRVFHNYKKPKVRR